MKQVLTQIWNTICGIGIFALGAFYIYALVAMHTPPRIGMDLEMYEISVHD